MPQTNYDVLARSFFDLANKVEQIAGSEVAQDVKNFEADDYASIVASLLDAAYWILSEQLDEGLKDDPLGHELYTSSSTYNDLLYRGYSPGWAWEESGMGDMFGHAPDHDDDEGGEEGGEDSGITTLTSSAGLKPGDYVMARHADGAVTGGMILSSTEMFSFDGRRDTYAGLSLTKLTPIEAHDMMEAHEQSILKSVERWVDGQSD